MLKKSLPLLIILVLITGLLITSCKDIVTGSGETETFEMDYTNFSRIEISTGFEVEITQADSFFVSITIDKSLYEYVNIARRGDTLHVGLKANYIYTAASRKAVINLPDLRRLELSGGSTASVSGFNLNHNIDIELSGASAMALNPMESEDASFKLSGGSSLAGIIQMKQGRLDVSGSSTLHLSGTTTGLVIKASSASNIIVDNLPVASADVVLNGGSHAAVNVTDTLNVEISGGSTLTYTGNPKLGKMDISGGSILEQAE